MPDNPQPLLYTELAPWFHLLTRPEEYAEEAAIFTKTIRRFLPGARSLLELGCGGGNNASHLKQHFDLTLTDLSPAMLAISQRLNPGVPHHQGDMRSVRLGQTFDVVFVHDAVMYLTAEDDLRQLAQTAALHLRPGGLVLICPDFFRENFRPSVSINGADGSDGFPPEYAGRSLRSLEWTYDPDPTDTTFITEFAHLLKKEPDQVRCVYDRHIEGLFPRATWLGVLEEAGFQAQTLPFEHSEVPEGQTEMLVGLKAG
jgi:SAM-dependent methyltransferase